MLGRYTTGPAASAEDSRVRPRPSSRPAGLSSTPMPDLIDLRSRHRHAPTPAMRRAMAEAEVGDDVFGDDPTVIALEERAAELTGKEAGLFVASGTMGNLVAHMAHVPAAARSIAAAQSHTSSTRPAGHAVIVGAARRGALAARPDGTHGPRRRCAPRSATRPTSTSRSPPWSCSRTPTPTRWASR